MPQFFGIELGAERFVDGLRVRVEPDGEAAWLGGKRLDLAPHHGVIVGRDFAFVNSAGVKKSLGDFPAWVVRSKSKRPAMIAAMFDTTQFAGGIISIGGAQYPVAAV